MRSRGSDRPEDGRDEQPDPPAKGRRWGRGGRADAPADPAVGGEEFGWIDDLRTAKQQRVDLGPGDAGPAGGPGDRPPGPRREAPPAGPSGVEPPVGDPPRREPPAAGPRGQSGAGERPGPGIPGAPPPRRPAGPPAAAEPNLPWPAPARRRPAGRPVSPGVAPARRRPSRPAPRSGPGRPARAPFRPPGRSVPGGLRTPARGRPARASPRHPGRAVPGGPRTPPRGRPPGPLPGPTSRPTGARSPVARRCRRDGTVNRIGPIPAVGRMPGTPVVPAPDRIGPLLDRTAPGCPAPTRSLPVWAPIVARRQVPRPGRAPDRDRPARPGLIRPADSRTGRPGGRLPPPTTGWTVPRVRELPGRRAAVRAPSAPASAGTPGRTLPVVPARLTASRRRRARAHRAKWISRAGVSRGPDRPPGRTDPAGRPGRPTGCAGVVVRAVVATPIPVPPASISRSARAPGGRRRAVRRPTGRFPPCQPPAPPPRRTGPNGPSRPTSGGMPRRCPDPVRGTPPRRERPVGPCPRVGRRRQPTRPHPTGRPPTLRRSPADRPRLTHLGRTNRRPARGAARVVRSRVRRRTPAVRSRVRQCCPAARCPAHRRCPVARSPVAGPTRSPRPARPGRERTSPGRTAAVGPVPRPDPDRPHPRAG